MPSFNMEYRSSKFASRKPMPEDPQQLMSMLADQHPLAMSGSNHGMVRF
jgi:hypothetical protein